MENTIAESDDITLDLLLKKVYRDRGYDFGNIVPPAKR